MFAALMVARLREAVFDVPGLRDTRSWVSPDEVAGTDLPLARATAKVLASMHSVLEKTLEARTAELAAAQPDEPGLDEAERERLEHLRRTKAAEVRLVRNVEFLQRPVVEFQAQEFSKEDLPDLVR